MKPQIKKRLKRTAILSLIALAIGAGMGWMQIRNETATVTEKGEGFSPVAGVRIGGPYTLTDQDGNTVTEKSFEGQHKLIYFGFTYCPAICPTELQKITQALNDLGPEAENIQPVFITVDPERDTAEVMKSYVAQFHPRLVGFTGTRAQIDDVLKSYRIYASKVQEPEMSDYTMDHSSFIYFMGPDDTLLGLYRVQDSAAFIAGDIRKRISS